MPCGASRLASVAKCRWRPYTNKEFPFACGDTLHAMGPHAFV